MMEEGKKNVPCSHAMILIRAEIPLGRINRRGKATT
jgi:hypothetical protein